MLIELLKFVGTLAFTVETRRQAVTWAYDSTLDSGPVRTRHLPAGVFGNFVFENEHPGLGGRTLRRRRQLDRALRGRLGDHQKHA